jgi:hypothetical protein
MKHTVLMILSDPGAGLSRLAESGRGRSHQPDATPLGTLRLEVTDRSVAIRLLSPRWLLLPTGAARPHRSCFLTPPVAPVPPQPTPPPSELPIQASATASRPANTAGTVADLEDTSAGGACLQMNFPLPLGSPVRLRVARVSLQGQVRYCDFREIAYHLGICFNEGQERPTASTRASRSLSPNATHRDRRESPRVSLSGVHVWRVRRV